MSRLAPALFLVAMLPLAASADGTIIDVTVTGTVEYNLIGQPPLNGFTPGAPASLTFTIDATSFVNSPNFPTRGYPIDKASFVLTSGAASISLQNPFPPGQTPYFVLRNNDPGVDGFFVANSVDFPTGVPLNQTHTGGQRFNHTFMVTYGPTALSSLDVLDALGTYDYTGLSVYNWTTWHSSPDLVFMEIMFGELTISRRTECPGDLSGDSVVNQADLGILLADFGCAAGVGNCPGDVNGDGSTDQADLGILLANFGNRCP